MKIKTKADKLISNLLNNIGHPMFFEGYKVLMRDEEKVLKNEIKSEIRKFKREMSQKFEILIGCIISFVINFIWFISIPFVKSFNIIKLMFLLPIKVKEHQKLIKAIKTHPKFSIIENEFLSKK